MDPQQTRASMSNMRQLDSSTTSKSKQNWSVNGVHGGGDISELEERMRVSIEERISSLDMR